MVKKLAMTLGIGLLYAAGCAIAADNCTYKGTDYSHGSAVCQSGTQFRCDDGKWKGLGMACTQPMVLSKSCEYKGYAYSAGAASCQAGTEFRCDNGSWKALGVACTVSGDTPIRVAPLRRTCMYEGATVSNLSSICKAGTTFLCEDGEWRNLGTPCQ